MPEKDLSSICYLKDERFHSFLQILKKTKIRTTKQRLLILYLLKEQTAPIDAQTLYQLAKDWIQEEDPDFPPFWLSTVYRTLDLFVLHDVVEKVVHFNDHHAAYILKGGHHQHYAICTNCHTILPFEDCPHALWENHLAQDGFKMTGHRIEVYGVCKQCQEEINEKGTLKGHE